MDKFFPAALSLTLLSCVNLSLTPIRQGGAVYRQLTGEQLRTAIEGKQLTFPDDRRSDGVFTSGVRCHRFHVKGQYMSCRHRADSYGTYVISHDRVCATEGYQRTTCWAFYRSSKAGYLLRILSPVPAPAEQVTVLALPELNRR